MNVKVETARLSAPDASAGECCAQAQMACVRDSLDEWAAAEPFAPAAVHWKLAA